MSWYKEKEINKIVYKKKYKNTKLLHVKKNLRKTITMVITNNNTNNKGL